MDQNKRETKLEITEGALTQRINRKLRRNRQRLCAVRGAGAESNLGYHVILDTNRNVITETQVNLENLGRRLGVMEPWEALVTA
jgi:hypothetical protein